MATFYVIGTPIGNLEDITLRALNVLKTVDVILCEDTRMTAKLLQKYDIKKTLHSYHAHSTVSKMEKVFELLETGKDLALVSDAGTPGISDPGCLIVSQIREKFTTDHVRIVAIPGPSALTAALSISGLPASDFLFLGFLPHKKGRETLFKEIAESERIVAFYESPHRIMKALESLRVFCPTKTVVIARELTKIYEETVQGTPEQVIEYFNRNPDKVRGEFVVMVSSIK